MNAMGQNVVELAGKNGETARIEIDPKTSLPAS